MTNHHVGADALQKLGSKEQDLIKTGFRAKTRDEEIKCVDLELNVLMSIEDVTARVNAAVTPGMEPAKAFEARRAVMSTIEKESLDKTGLRSDVITLYQGGLYHLYRFKKYTDVRLVFAPEQDAAFFGGDPDNFEYPRYDLDICFFRVYEDGKPVRLGALPQVEHGRGGRRRTGVRLRPPGTHRPAEHRGRTWSTSATACCRGRSTGSSAGKCCSPAYSERSAENARRAQDELFGVQNRRKARLGGLAGLQDPAVMAAKADRRGQTASGRGRRPEAGQDRRRRPGMKSPPRSKVAASIQDDMEMLESGRAFRSDLFGIARTLVRLAEESEKPNAQRLREYGESHLESLKQELFSEAPIYDDLETAPTGRFAQPVHRGGRRRQPAGPEGPRRQVARRTARPNWSAARSSATSPSARSWPKGGRKAIEASDDPMIRLALLVDGPARAVRKTYEEKVEEPMRQAYAKIADARFALLGSSTYPDATFTLRLAFGPVKGYTEAGKPIPPWTTMGGAYQSGRGAQQQAAVRAAGHLAQTQGQAGPQDAAQLRLRRRHHRRQLRQPGGQPQGRAGGHHLRRQPRIAGLGLRLHRRGGPGPGRRRPRHHRGPPQNLRRRTPGG